MRVNCLLVTGPSVHPSKLTFGEPELGLFHSIVSDVKVGGRWGAWLPVLPHPYGEDHAWLQIEREDYVPRPGYAIATRRQYLRLPELGSAADLHISNLVSQHFWIDGQMLPEQLLRVLSQVDPGYWCTILDCRLKLTDEP